MTGYEILVRILGVLLIAIGGYILYNSLIGEQKLWKKGKRENDYGANINIIFGGAALVFIGIVVLLSGKF